MRSPKKTLKLIFASYVTPLWAGIFLFSAIGLRWIWRFRAGQPLDIDEAGYLGLSYLDYYGLVHGGIGGYFSAIESSNVQAPLSPALAALIYCVIGPNWIFGFGVPLLAGIGTIVATYALGRALGSRHVAAISALLVGSCPVIINFSRSFHFSIPATFVTTMAFVALLRSNRCRQVGWASMFGICLGLMPLARTMTIGFIPGLVIGAFTYVVIDGEERKRRLITLCCSFLLAFLVTGAWLFPNRNEIFRYLLNYGYGNHAAEYGPSMSTFGWDAWLTQTRIFIFYIHLPHAIFAGIGILALLSLMVQRFTVEGQRAARSILTSNATPLAIFVTESIVALTSTQNKGSAFLSPFLPAAFVVAVWACDKVFSAVRLHHAMLWLAIIVGLLGTIPSVDGKLAHYWAIEVPVLGWSTVIDGRGTIQLYETAAGYQSGAGVPTINRTAGYAWIAASGFTESKLGQHGSARTKTAFGFRHFLYNTNTVGLEQWVSKGVSTAFAMVDPVDTGDNVAGDIDWLTRGGANDACLLLTSEGDIGYFKPIVSQVTMTEAAKKVGFAPIDNWLLPDGQKIILWRRDSTDLHCDQLAANGPQGCTVRC
jgi:4-amino-4-deoxy-L-arabinose transferase-like glycosyltransferase